MSIAGGMHKAVERSVQAGAKSMAFFTRSARTWTCPEMKEGEASKFKAACHSAGFAPSCILPHGTYLSNSGSGVPELRAKSIDAIKDEMGRCAALGLSLYNFHPGSTTGSISVDTCCKNVSAAIDECCAAVPGVTMVIETMAGQGGSVGSSLEEIRDMIARVADKSRVGVCVDTAHIHAAGYDIRSTSGWDAYVRDFDSVVGLKYLVRRRTQLECRQLGETFYSNLGYTGIA